MNLPPWLARLPLFSAEKWVHDIESNLQGVPCRRDGPSPILMRNRCRCDANHRRGSQTAIHLVLIWSMRLISIRNLLRTPNGGGQKIEIVSRGGLHLSLNSNAHTYKHVYIRDRSLRVSSRPSTTTYTLQRKREKSSEARKYRNIRAFKGKLYSL